jgi:hypothetical protein
MVSKTAPLLALAVVAGGALHAESSEYPLALNLPTVDKMVYWDIGAVFTHRFNQPVKDNGKNVYGLDGYTYAGLGFTFGIKPIKGLNVIVYRTADNKTFTLGFQQQILDHERIRMAFRAERFDEVVDKNLFPPDGVTPTGKVGISGEAFQLPTEIYITDDIIFTLDPAFITRTTTSNTVLHTLNDTNPPTATPGTKENTGGVFNIGAGLRVNFTEKFGAIVEYYPRPSKFAKAAKVIPGGTATGDLIESYKNGFAFGVTYKTFKHRFSLMGTNVNGTTANQVLSGDYYGGPRASSQWSIGFNVTRVF